MHVEILTALSDNYMYLIVDDDSAAVIDPTEANPVISAVNKAGVKLDIAIITHSHFDHTGGCQKLKKSTGCSIVGATIARISCLDKPLNDGDSILVGNCEFRSITTPGHTLDHMAYYAPKYNMLFTGDFLFAYEP